LTLLWVVLVVLVAAMLVVLEVVLVVPVTLARFHTQPQLAAVCPLY
jgi:hypothetical protein